MAKWPNVPAVYGWLALDRRGHWLIKGDRITNPVISDFIGRNYARDGDGNWFFQNGPQRVYVELVYTPFVVRLSTDDATGQLALTDQAGVAFEPAATYLDDEGGILFTDKSAPARIAVLHDHDLDLFSEHAELAGDGHRGQFLWRDDIALTLEPVRKADVMALWRAGL